MRSTIITAVLLALTAPAHASSAAEWDCGNKAKAVSNKGYLSLETTMGRAYAENAYPARGSQHLDWKWDFRGDSAKVWLNGKLCKRTN